MEMETVLLHTFDEWKVAIAICQYIEDVHHIGKVEIRAKKIIMKDKRTIKVWMF